MRVLDILLAVAIALVLGGFLVLGVTAVSGTAAAQEANATDEETTVLKDVDGDVRVLSTEYHSGEMLLEVTVENTGDDDATVHMIEVMERDQNDAAAFGSWGVDGGETATIQMENIRDHGGAEGVAITTDQSLEEGVAPEWLTVGESSSPWYEPTWNTVRLAVLSAVGFLVLFAVLYGWHRLSGGRNIAPRVNLP